MKLIFTNWILNSFFFIYILIEGIFKNEYTCINNTNIMMSAINIVQIKDRNKILISPYNY